MRGTGMAAKDANGLSDPYVKIKNGGVKKKTSVKPKARAMVDVDLLFAV